MNDEAKLWQDFKKVMGVTAHMTRIESHATSIGQPDVNYCINAVEGNVELKYTNNSKKGLTLRPSQWQWFKKRVAMGGTPWLLAWVDIPMQKPYYILISGQQAVKHELIHHNSITIWKRAGRVIDTLDYAQLQQIMMTGDSL